MTKEQKKVFLAMYISGMEEANGLVSLLEQETGTRITFSNEQYIKRRVPETNYKDFAVALVDAGETIDQNSRSQTVVDTLNSKMPNLPVVGLIYDKNFKLNNTVENLGPIVRQKYLVESIKKYVR